MNEEAIQDAYKMFKSGGYSGSIDDYKQLISTNGNALKDSYEIFKGGGYNQDIDSFKTLMGLKKKSDWGSTLGDGSSVSQKNERKATKEIAKTKDLRNVADKGSEIFTGYPGKEKNQYEFSNGSWYELNPEVEKTIKKSKESYVPVGGLPMGGGMFVNPSGEGQDFATPGTSKNSLDAIKNVPKKRIIEDDARIKALNKQFGKNASLDADYETFGDYDNSPEKKDNKYRIKNNSWERLVPGATGWSSIENEGSISALNRRYGKNIEAKKTIVVKPKEIDPFLKVNTNFLAQSEESAQEMLEKNFKGMGFTFEQVGAGDYIKVTPNNGVPSQTFSFNNVGNSTRGAFSSPTGMGIGNSNSKELEKNADQSVKLQSYLRLNASAEKEDDLSAVNRIKNNTSSKKESNLDIKSAIENNKYYESEDYKNAFKELTFQQKREEIKRRRSENANLSSTAGTGLAGKLATAIFGEDEKYYENANTLKKFENKLNNSEEYKVFLSEQKKYDAQKGEKYDKLYDEYIIATRSGNKEAIKTAKAKIEGGYSKDLIGDNLNHMTGTQYDLQRDINNFNKRKEKLQLDAKNGNLTEEQYNDAVESLSSEAQRLDIAAKNVAATQKKMNVLAGIYATEKAKSGGFFGNAVNGLFVQMDAVRNPLSTYFPLLGKDLSGEEERKIATEAQIITPQQRQYYKDKGYSEQEIKNVFLNNAKKKSIAANKRAIIETFGSDLTTKESRQNLSFVEESLIGAIESLPSIATSLIPFVGPLAAFHSMASMSYDAINEEMFNDTDFETTSEADRAFVALPYAVVMGALENIGLKNMTAGKSAILGKYVLGQFAKIIPKKLGREAVENIVNKEVKSLVGKGVLKVVSGGFAEAETGAIQTLVADIGIKKAYNSIRAAYTGEDLKELTGGEAFGTPQSFSEGLMAVGEGALAEAIGGVAMSTVLVGSQGLINGEISLYNEEDLKFFKDFSSDQEFKKLIVSNLKTQMLNGTMTKGEAQSALNDINLVEGVFNSIDENISDEAKLIAFNLINERNRLEKEKQGKDPALSKEKNDRIKDINDKLETLPLQILVVNNIERATKLENALKQKGAVIIDGETINRKAAQTELNKINQKVEDAVQKQAAGQVPVQPTTAVGEEVVQGEPTTEPQVLTEEGKAEEINPLKDVESTVKALELEDKSDNELQGLYESLSASKNEDVRVLSNMVENVQEKKERFSILNSPLNKISDVIDNIFNKTEYFLEKKEAREAKQIAKKYSGNVSPQDAKKDFKDAFFGRPESWVADALKMRESVRVYTENGGTFKDLLSSVQKEFESDGFTEQEAADVIKNKIEALTKKDFRQQQLSEAYHKAKADGSNPELVKAVEELLIPTTEGKVEEVVLTEKQRIEAEIAKKEAKAKGKTPKYARNVAALITPATTRNFDSTTKRMQKLSLKYDALVKKMEESKVVTNEDEKELKKLENQILGQVKREIIEGISKIKGVEVLFRDNYSGAWGGVAEPSMNMSLKITEDADTEAISRLLQEFGEKYSQDAIIIETTSEFSDDIINEKIKPKFSYADNRGFLHYPQIFYKFASTPTAKQLADLGKLLKENGINDYSFNNNELKVSIISFEGNQTETQLKQDYEKRHEKIKQSVINALGLTEDGDVVSTEVRYRKSRYVGSENDGDTSTEERPYDRSDIFKEVKEDVIKAQEEGLELGSIRDKQIALQEKGRDLNSAEKRRLAKLTSTVQPIVQETFETKEKDFEEAKKEVESIADRAIRRLKGFVSKFAIKRPTRASVKTLRWYSADTEKLGDGARVNIIVPTDEEANLVFKNIDEGNKKDSQLRRINEATELGYPKRLIEIRAKNGVISEIQVMTPEGYLAKDGYKFFPPEQQEEAKQKLEETQQKFGWAIPDGLGHYFYEIERDFNVDKSLREEAKRLSLKYYNAFLNNVKWDEQQFADEMSAFKDRVDSDKKIGWDAGNEGKSPKSLDAFLNKEKAAPVVKKESYETKSVIVKAVGNARGEVGEYSVSISKDGKTAKVRLKKMGSYEATGGGKAEANLEIKTDENKKRFVTTTNKTKVYIDEVITPAKVETAKAKVTSKTKVKAETVKKKVKVEAPAPEKESTTGEDTIFNNIEVIQKEIDGINQAIAKAKKDAKDKIVPIREQIEDLKEAIGKEGTIMDLEADIKEFEDILKEELYGKENDTYKGLVSDLNKKTQELQDEFNKLGSLKISSAENKKRLSEYIDDAIAKLNSLNKFTYAGIGVGTSLATMKLILKGINALVKAAESISLDEAIARMYTKYKVRHPKVKREQFIKEINYFLDTTFVKQKTNKQDLQDTQDRLAEFKEAVKLAISLDRKESEKLRIEAERVVRKMLTGKVDTLDSIQMKSIMLRLAKFNVLSQRQYDKFIDYVDKIIGIAGYDAKVDKANTNRKNAKKNLPKLGDISSDLLDPLSRLLSINAKLIPSDVFESYSEIVEMLSQRDAVLKLNKRDDLNESIDKIIESIESNEQRVSDLKELYDNFEDKVVEDKVVNYAETLDEMLKVGIINQSEHKLMKTFKSKIQGPKVKAKMTEQEIADEKVELINEINNTTITLDEIVGDEFRLERDLIKRLQELLKNKKTLESLNNKDLKDLLRVIDNINNGFISNATQEMVEKLNFIEKSILLESSIPENFKNIAKKINQTLAKRVSKRINVAPLFNIDQQLGDFKTKNIFNSVFNESAKAQQGYQSAITLIQDELDKIERGIATSFENEPNKIILSQFKMMVYMMQLEYDSNPTKQEGSKKQVHQAMKTLDETIKFAKQNSEKSGYNELDIAQMESIKKEFEKNNEIDIDKLYNSFNEAEKNGLKKLEEINNRMTKFATYTATVINGKKIVPLKNYISYTVINESDILSASETTDQINNINANMDPGTVSKNLEERDGKAHPVYLNPFYATNSSSRSVLLNYHMTEPVRTARKTLRNAKTLLEEKKGTTTDQYDILNAITSAYNTATKDLLESNFTQSAKWLEFLKRQGYRSMLASGTRAAAELSSNIAFVLLNNPRDMRRGVSKEIKEIEGVDRKSIMTNLKSNVTSRVQPTSLINSPFVELTANANRSSKSKNTKTEIRNGIRQAWDETGKQYVDVVAGVADYLISKPDQVIMRRLWFGSFSRTFEKEVGIKPDFDKIIKNDEEYMDKYKDALEKATTMADKQVISAGSSMNSYMGILQNVVRQDDKGGVVFLKEFNRFMNKFTVQEYYTAREGVRALVGNGTISREEGIQILAAVTLRMTIYSVFTKLFSEGLLVVARSLGFGGDDDDDDKTTKQKISQGILSSITTLVFGRYFGNFIRVAENALIELANKEYGEAIGLRDGEYDPYKDAIQFNQLQEGKVDKLTDFVKVVAGPLSPVIGTAELAYKLATSSKPEGERAKLTRAKELYRRLPLEIGGLAGVVPFYKDFRKIVMEGVYKELKKETKETAVKKEAEEIKTALTDSQKISSLKEMRSIGEYTKEEINNAIKRIKDPEYRKTFNDKEEAIKKKILDKYGYENLTDFKRNDEDNYEIEFGDDSPYRIERAESAKITLELKKRMDAIKDGEEYYSTEGAAIVAPKKKANKYNRFESRTKVNRYNRFESVKKVNKYNRFE